MNAPAVGGSTTAVTVAYPIGGATLSMKSYDGANGTGTLLGEVDTVPVVTTGVANTIDLVIEGIAHSVALSVVPNQPLLVGNATTGYTILGDDPAIFNAVLKDADGNIILNGQPPITTSGASSIGVGYANASESQISFLGTKQSTGYENIVVSFNNPDGTVISAPSVKIKDEPLVAAIDSATNSISLFDAAGNAVALPSGSFAGLVHPVSIAYDQCVRLLVVADSSLNTLMFYGLDGESYPYSVGPFPGISDPVAVQTYVGVSSTEYAVANDGDNSIRSYDIFGNTSNPWFWSYKPSAIACLNDCTQIAEVSSGGQGTIVNYQGTPPTRFFPGLNQPVGLLGTYGLNPIVYALNRGNNSITTYDTSGQPVTVTGTFPGLSQPGGFTYNPASLGILVTNDGNNSVSAYDLQGNAVALPTGAFPGLQTPSAILGIPIGQCYN